jgi:multimeric flavodoxin WrbA/putative sterol carrier protein
MIKRSLNVLPHIIVSVYIVLINTMGAGILFARAACLAALFLFGLLAYRARAKGALSPVHKAYLLYFSVNAVGFWILPGSLSVALRSAPSAFLYGSLLALALLPALLGGRHFTEYFARKMTPPAVWETQVFKEINRTMSWAWIGLFAASLAVALIPSVFSMNKGVLTVAVFQVALPGILMLGLGLPLNKKYPAYYQRRVGVQPVRLFRSGADDRRASPVIDDKGKEKVMQNQLKVVAVNGSPHMNGGNTSIMTQMMAPVLAAEGIDLEEVFLAGKRIEYCVGCGLCMEKGKCWRQDDHAEILRKVLSADGVILASPVYFKHVTAQMKVFLDRSLAYGHKPRGTWKPGLAVSVSAGMAETTTAEYLAGLLRVYGSFPVATLTAIAVGPGSFVGKELVEARAADVARDLARAIKEKRRYPATENDLFYYLFMGDLVRRQKDFMRDDFRHWQESGFYDGFETYVGQRFSKPPYDGSMRKEWIRDMIAKEAAGAKGGNGRKAKETPVGRPVFKSCRELLRAMPMGFRKEAAEGLEAVYQFEISGAEDFTAHLDISNGNCTYADGPCEKPDVIVKSPADVWLSVSRGETNGQAAFMSGKYKAEGDLGLLMKLGSLFGP